MTLKGSVYNSKFVKELQQTPRLQWMMFVIVMLIILSISKSLYDTLAHKQEDVKTSLDLAEKLRITAANPIDDEALEQTRTKYSAIINGMPIASSSPVAEAEALVQAEQQFGRLLQNRRLNMIGSEDFSVGGNDFIQVRVEISGQLDPVNFIDVLNALDSNTNAVRGPSFRYNPDASNRLNMVADFLFLRRGDE